MDRSHQYPHRTLDLRAVFVCAGLIGLLPMPSLADGARVAQKAKPGEIVLLRNVAARPADRAPTAPGMALMISGSPNPQLANTLTGTGNPGETTDAEIANLNAGPGAGGGLSVQNDVQRSLHRSLGTAGNSGGAVSGNGVSNTLSAPTGAAGAGAVADSTRNIGDQVTNAISQLPVLGAGH